MLWEPALKQFVDGIESSNINGIPTIMLIVCLKNCLEFKQKIYSAARGPIQNFCLLLSLGLGASIVIGILTSKTPSFMLSDSPVVCYSLGYLAVIVMPDAMAKAALQLVLPFWMISRHISALNSDSYNQAILSLTGRFFLAFSNYSGGLLFLSLLGAFDPVVMSYVSSSMNQSLIVNGALSLILVITRSFLSKSHSVILFVMLQEAFKRIYQRFNINANDKTVKKKLKVK